MEKVNKQTIRFVDRASFVTPLQFPKDRMIKHIDGQWTLVTEESPPFEESRIVEDEFGFHALLLEAVVLENGLRYGRLADGAHRLMGAEVRRFPNLSVNHIALTEQDDSTLPQFFCYLTKGLDFFFDCYLGDGYQARFHDDRKELMVLVNKQCGNLEMRAKFYYPQMEEGLIPSQYEVFFAQKLENGMRTTANFDDINLSVRTGHRKLGKTRWNDGHAGLTMTVSNWPMIMPQNLADIPSFRVAKNAALAIYFWSPEGELEKGVKSSAYVQGFGQSEYSLKEEELDPGNFGDYMPLRRPIQHIDTSTVLDYAVCLLNNPERGGTLIDALYEGAL